MDDHNNSSGMFITRIDFFCIWPTVSMTPWGLYNNPITEMTSKLDLIRLYITSWWLNQPLWKICSSKWVHLPQTGMNIKTYLKPPPQISSFLLYIAYCNLTGQVELHTQQKTSEMPSLHISEARPERRWWWLVGGMIAADHMDVSKNRGTPKWMVYNGKPY